MTVVKKGLELLFYTESSSQQLSLAPYKYFCVWGDCGCNFWLTPAHVVLYNNCIGWVCEKPETDFRNGLMLSKFVQSETDSYL